MALPRKASPGPSATSGRLARAFSRSADLWRSIPAPAYALFLAAIFLLFGTIGCLTDLLALGRARDVPLAARVLFSGSTAAVIAYAATRRPRLLPVAVLAPFACAYALRLALPRPAEPTGPVLLADARGRIVVDVLGCSFLIMGGYCAFLTFINREASRFYQVRAEMALARELHLRLVPDVACSALGFAIVGRSIASGAMGGDLVDVVASSGATTALVADVSGHGVPAGALMGMVKAMARARLEAGGGLAEEVEGLNRLLHPLKAPNVFVTLAALRWQAGHGEVELLLAGHLPVLMVARGASEVQEMALRQLPLGVRAAQRFETRRFPVERGDLLVVVSDGLTEVFDRTGQPFALAGIRRVVAASAGLPLPEIASAILESAQRHGAQDDDQTVLLLRRE